MLVPGPATVKVGTGSVPLDEYTCQPPTCPGRPGCTGTRCEDPLQMYRVIPSEPRLNAATTPPQHRHDTSTPLAHRYR